MALIEKTLIDKIEIVENNIIQIRTANIIEKDGKEVSRTFHRHAVCPIDDITNEDERVKLIANAIWTKEVIEEYKKQMEENSNLIK